MVIDTFIDKERVIKLLVENNIDKKQIKKVRQFGNSIDIKFKDGTHKEINLK
jgi:hypothetical protein